MKHQRFKKILRPLDHLAKFNWFGKKGKIILSLLPLLFLILPSLSFSRPHYPELKDKSKVSPWDSPLWHRLLHYRKNLFGGYESEADGETFFVHPEGKRKPRLEFEALVQSLNEKSEITDKHPMCLFPARIKWLQKELGLKKDLIQFERCQAYQNFRRRHDAKKVFLVFSSYYLESPASTFGHTLLRFSKNDSLKEGKYEELLDTAINFGANQTTDNPLVYSVLGTIGGFKGTLSSLPYYYKIREYNDHESRDLWSYELNLNEEEIDRLLDHIWEVGQTHFDYYYFDENCSYFLLTFLEVAKPDLDLVSKLPSYVIPVDTIKFVKSTPGLVLKVHYRPSIRRVTEDLFSQLNSKEEKLAHLAFKNQDHHLITQGDISLKEKSYALDALIGSIDLSYSNQILNEKGEQYNWKMKVLEKRSELNHPGIISKVKIPQEEIPHEAHGSARAGTQFGYDSKYQSSLLLNYRFALHDILDPYVGQPKTSSIEFLNTKLKYYPDLKKLRLHELIIVQVKNLHPWNRFQKLPTLDVKFGAKTAPSRLCYLCTTPNVDLGWGASFNLSDSLVFMGTLKSQFLFSGEFKKNKLAIGIGPEFSLFYWWGHKTSSELKSNIEWFPLQEERDFNIFHESRFHFSKKLSFFIKNGLRSGESENSLGLFLYH